MRHWWRSYALLLQWQLLRNRHNIPYSLALQAVISAGIVVGFSYLIPHVDDRSVLYLTTGAMTMTLVMVGMSLAPQVVTYQKTAGSLDFQRSLPVPRLALLAADATIWLAIALPGLAVTVTAASIRFDLSFATSPLVVPAVLLVAAGSVAVGYGIAYAVRPALVGIVTNLVMVISLMFAPINYPAERLPSWAAAIHEWLPFQYMAQAIRETIDVPASGISLLPFAVLTAWAAAGLAITSRVMTRRT
jgi:ABC-2 type transport system permease protein